MFWHRGVSKDKSDDSGEPDNEYLIDQDYIYADLIKDGKVYKLIHGFPGDTPLGTVYVHGPPAEFITNLSGGLNTKGGLDEFNGWYTNITKGGTEYDKTFFVNL